MLKAFSNISLAGSLFFLSAALYTGIVGANGCDHADTVLTIGFPGFVALVLSAGLRLVGERPKLFSKFWIITFVALLESVILIVQIAHLNKTAVGDCQ